MNSTAEVETRLPARLDKRTLHVDFDPVTGLSKVFLLELNMWDHSIESVSVDVQSARVNLFMDKFKYCLTQLQTQVT